MRKLMALFTACLMAAVMMVLALAVDLEEVPDVVVLIDDNEGAMPYKADLCDCGGALRVMSGPTTTIVPGSTKYPDRMCMHGNPQHMVVDRTQVITTWYRCDVCDQKVKVEHRSVLSPDCIVNN